jgi:hypothetical protein
MATDPPALELRTLRERLAALPACLDILESFEAADDVRALLAAFDAQSARLVAVTAERDELDHDLTNSVQGIMLLAWTLGVPWEDLREGQVAPLAQLDQAAKRIVAAARETPEPPACCAALHAEHEREMDIFAAKIAQLETERDGMADVVAAARAEDAARVALRAMASDPAVADSDPALWNAIRAEEAAWERLHAVLAGPTDEEHDA